jgi:ornithine cyclodeaminase/alanine dehydrogenase-like protein (mu-crystallin family)
MKIKILSRNEVQQAVTMQQAIDVVKQAFISFAQKEAILPLRIQVPVKEYKGMTLFMPAYLSKMESLGAKIVSVFPENVKHNMPTIHAMVITCDAKTGQPTAMMDGTYLTALRTGAVSGVATDLLARKEIGTAAIIGAGIQGRTQLEAICCVREIQKVFVYDKNPRIAESFSEEMQNRGKPIPGDISVVSCSEMAVAEADVMCVATTSSTPVFEDTHLKSGVHINGVGSHTPQMQEIPEKTILRARVVVDSVAACLEEAGDLIIPVKKGLIKEAHILGELGQVASGLLTVRDSDEDITFFKSVGLAIQDVAVAELALRKATNLQLGMNVDV